MLPWLSYLKPFDLQVQLEFPDMRGVVFFVYMTSQQLTDLAWGQGGELGAQGFRV